MKIALIVQRYGTEILGGSEYHCRLIAERLAVQHDVEVLTTCAKDYLSWSNEYPEGSDRIRGVTVKRFANAQTRDITSFNKYSDWIFANPHTAEEEDEWLKQQGPWCPALIDYLKRRHASYDTLIFFTYLYAPTVLGLRIDPQRSILVPTAHDEPAITLGIYKELFRLPKAIAFNTGVERRFLHSRFDIRAKAKETVGCGVDLSLHLEDSDDGMAPNIEERGLFLDDQTQPKFTSAAEFQRRYRLYGPFALFGGRIEPGKGCEELIEYFSTYASDQGDTILALMGAKLMPIPSEPFIRFAGMLPENERLEALQAAAVVIVPSPYESLSLLTLEAFAVETPVLVNARSDVLTDHCQRSNAGLYYSNREEFVECLKLLIKNSELRTNLGRNGRAYVEANYSWEVILDKYERMFSAITGQRKQSATRRPRARNRTTGGRRPNRSKPRSKTSRR